MHSAITTLETTARRLQRSGELEGAEFTRLMTHLRSLADGLGGVERRMAKRQAASVDFNEILHAAMAPASPARQGERGVRPRSKAIMVQGPSQDLRYLFGGLAEYARTAGADPLEMSARVTDGNEACSKCTMTLVIPAPDLPDFLRRKLWDAARIRGGEVSIISESMLCRIEFTIPLDRRSATSG